MDLWLPQAINDRCGIGLCFLGNKTNHNDCHLLSLNAVEIESTSRKQKGDDSVPHG